MESNRYCHSTHVSFTFHWWFNDQVYVAAVLPERSYYSSYYSHTGTVVTAIASMLGATHKYARRLIFFGKSSRTKW